MPIYERYSKKRKEKITLAKFNLSFKENEVELYRRFCQLYSEDILSKFVKCAMQKAIDRKDYFEYTLFDDSDDFMSVRTTLTRKV